MPVLNSTITTPKITPTRTASKTSTISSTSSTPIKSKVKTRKPTALETINTFDSLPPVSTETIDIAPEIGKEFIKQISNPSFTPTHQIIIGSCVGFAFLMIIIALCIKGHSRPTHFPKNNYPTSVVKSPTKISSSEARERRG